MTKLINKDNCVCFVSRKIDLFLVRLIELFMNQILNRTKVLKNENALFFQESTWLALCGLYDSNLCCCLFYL